MIVVDLCTDRLRLVIQFLESSSVAIVKFLKIIWQYNLCMYDLQIVEKYIAVKEVINVAAILATFYCIFVNCKTAVVSFKILSTDKLYPKLCRFNFLFTTDVEVYSLIIIVGFISLLSGNEAVFLVGNFMSNF